MIRVVVESPYRAETPEAIAENVEYARRCIRDSLTRGESPIASHLFYTQPGILRDEDPDERAHGISAGLAWQSSAELIAVYTDRGVTFGMQQAIDQARAYGITVEYRSIGPAS